MYPHNNMSGTTRFSVFKAVQLFTAGAFAAFLFVALNQTSTVNNDISTLNGRSPLRRSFAPGKNSGPVVEIPNGRIRGTVQTSRNKREFSAFYHIPYGEPPVGKRRFQPPRKYTRKWRGIRNATSRGGVDVGCIQYTGYSLDGKEDCLNLIVYTPTLPSRRNPRPNLAVLVYIYGGIFKFGRANQYAPDYIMDEDVVLVFPDFRTGPFGHLNTEDMEIRGNMAGKDQVLALKWIQENIEKFGGDPKRVLIFGNSSGAAHVNGLIISAMAKGLFSRAVSQSGSVALGSSNTSPRESVRQLGEKLNCTNVDDTRELHQCLVDADAGEIAIKFAELTDFQPQTREFIPDDGDVSDVFFPDYPLNLLANGSFQKVPWLAGSNSGEGYPNAHDLLTNPWAVYSLNKNWDELAPVVFNFEDDSTHKYSRALRTLYFGSKDVGQDTRYGLVSIISDIQWVRPVRTAVNHFAQNGGEAYFYLLTHEPVSSFGDAAKAGFTPPYGVAHADEIQYFFPCANEMNYLFPYIGTDSKDYQTSRNVIRIWVDFARNGFPSAPGVAEWPRIDETNPQETNWMQIDDTCKLIDPLSRRMTLLDTIPFRTTQH